MKKLEPITNLLDYISIDSKKRTGQACIRKSRITVSDIFGYLGGGMSVEEILTDFPYLTQKDIQAAYCYAANFLIKHEKR